MEYVSNFGPDRLSDICLNHYAPKMLEWFDPKLLNQEEKIMTIIKIRKISFFRLLQKNYIKIFNITNQFLDVLKNYYKEWKMILLCGIIFIKFSGKE